MNRDALALDQTQHLGNRGSALFAWVLTHRCQPGPCVSGKNVVVKPHHGNILRHPDPFVVEVIDGKGCIIIRCEKEGCKFAYSPGYLIIGLNNACCSKTYLKKTVFLNRNAVFFQSLTVSLPALIIDTHEIVCKKGNLFMSHPIK